MGFFNDIAGGVGDLVGGMIGAGERNAGQEELQRLQQYNPQNAGGFGGNVAFGPGGGQFTGNQQFQNFEQQLGQQGQNLLGGGLFNNAGFQQAFGNNDIAGALGQANQAFGMQQNPFFGAGAFQQNAANVNNLGNQFAQQTASGPQDFSGGLQQNLFAQGAANQTAAGDQSQLFNNSLSTQRQAAQAGQDRLFNKLQDKLFATGQLGSTGGGQQLEGLFNSFNQADLGFQNNAFNQAQQQQQFLGNLGGQQIAQGQGFLGQNLGQFNQTAQNAAQFAGLGGQFEGQGFGQGLAALQQNQSAGQQRLAAAQGLFGQGADVFGQQFGLGLGAQGANQAQNQFGLESILGLMNSENSRISAVGAAGQPAARQESGMGDFIGAAVKALPFFSDKRLKDNIERIGSLGNINWYTWDWNDAAKAVGADKQDNFGVIADEVIKTHPELVSRHESGYMMVDYRSIL
jgi:hypothetical protein